MTKGTLYEGARERVICLLWGGGPLIVLRNCLSFTSQSFWGPIVLVHFHILGEVNFKRLRWFESHSSFKFARSCILSC